MFPGPSQEALTHLPEQSCCPPAQRPQQPPGSKGCALGVHSSVGPHRQSPRSGTWSMACSLCPATSTLLGDPQTRPQGTWHPGTLRGQLVTGHKNHKGLQCVRMCGAQRAYCWGIFEIPPKGKTAPSPQHTDGELLTVFGAGAVLNIKQQRRAR